MKAGINQGLQFRPGKRIYGIAPTLYDTKHISSDKKTKQFTAFSSSNPEAQPSTAKYPILGKKEDL